MINNKNEETQAKNFEKFKYYLELIEEKGDSKRPSSEEVLMNHAFNISLRSQCLKRQVGAVIVNDQKYILSAGWNDTPRNITPCRFSEETQNSCYRDIIKKCTTEGCGGVIDDRNMQCPDCDNSLKKYNLSAKNLDLCRAVHAEENAILQLVYLGGNSLQGTTVFTTTSPCLLCAKKIITCGIKKVIYVDSYIAPQAWDMLRDGKIGVEKYEGCLPRVFNKLYRNNVIGGKK